MPFFSVRDSALCVAEEGVRHVLVCLDLSHSPGEKIRARAQDWMARHSFFQGMLGNEMAGLRARG